jgi:hypothetical protein
MEESLKEYAAIMVIIFVYVVIPIILLFCPDEPHK